MAVSNDLVLIRMKTIKTISRFHSRSPAIITITIAHVETASRLTTVEKIAWSEAATLTEAVKIVLTVAIEGIVTTEGEEVIISRVVRTAQKDSATLGRVMIR